jgi:hypothetical protein
MRKFIVFAFVILLAAGCSTHKKNDENKKTQPGSKAVAAARRKAPQPVTPAVPAVKTIPASTLSTIEGEVFFERYKDSKGNLFLYIIDETKLPDIVPIAASIYPEQTIQTQRLNFIMKNVPAGTWKIIAVWDTAQPFCKMTDLYCAASVKDGLGESSPLHIASGQLVSGVKINVY